MAQKPTVGYVWTNTPSGLVRPRLGAQLIYDSTLADDNSSSIDSGAVIPATFDVLQVYMYLRGTQASTLIQINVTVNGDTGANYDRETVRGTNTTTQAANNLTDNQWALNCPGASMQASCYGHVIITIPAYRQTTGHKAAWISDGITDSTAANNRVDLYACRWRNTAAINQIAVAAASNNLKAGSRMSVYGI